MPPKKSKVKHNQPTKSQAEVSSKTLPAQIPKLADLPPELFDEILSHLLVIPLDFYYDTFYDTKYGSLPHPKFRERTDALRALAGTCAALRAAAYHRLWSRLDICFIPIKSSGTWYKYVMQSIQIKAKGVINSSDNLKNSIRNITLMLSKSDVKETMTALARLFSVLPNLTTIQVVTCKIPGDFTKAMQGIVLPNVRTVVVPTDCHAVLKSCPNATHVRCAGGTGITLVGSLRACKCEKLDGMIDWVKDMKVVDRLVKNAPNLREIEIRRPVSWGLGILTQNTTPQQWSQVIPKLAQLQKLRIIVLSFPGQEEIPSDRVSIEAARVVLKNSALKEKEERKLIIRRVIAQHNSTVDHADGQVGDIICSCVEEVFY
ncbi:hypothetical protein QCA50_015059 [Cerrena zonata]|uniref:F-box domain-containing protein n=1 Tax=Cerrena zonata TaxID=2478898 RepID=A0AAW0FNJ8_9APHY